MFLIVPFEFLTQLYEKYVHAAMIQRKGRQAGSKKGGREERERQREKRIPLNSLRPL